MSALANLTKHALPAVLDEAQRTAASGPIDLSPLDGVVLFDVSDHDLLVVSGRDRVRFLHAMLSNDVKMLQVGEGRWLTFNNIRGKTVADVRLFVIDDDRKTGSMLALLEPGATALFVEGLDKYLISEKVYFEPDETSGRWILSGPRAGELLEAAGATLPEPGLYRHVETLVGGASVRVLRVEGATGSDYAIVGADKDAVMTALGEVQTAPRELLDAGRIANGRARHGIDFHTDHIPLEAGLSNLAISFTKGCYIGQEVICRVDSMGEPKRRLVRLDLGDMQTAPAPGTPLLAGTKPVGFTTSAFLGTDGPSAFGYVKKKSNAAGTELFLGDGGPTVLVGAPVGRLSSLDREA